MIQFVENPNFGKKVVLKGIEFRDDKRFIVIDENDRPLGKIEEYPFHQGPLYRFLPDIFFAEDFWHWYEVNSFRHVFEQLTAAKAYVKEKFEQYQRIQAPFQ